MSSDPVPPERPVTRKVDTRMAKALAHTVRVQALEILNRGPASPAMIARRLELPVANVSYHMNTLLRLRVIEEIETRHVRGAIEHIYRATRRGLTMPEDWSAMPETAREHFVAHVAEEIVEDLGRAINARLLSDDDRPHVTWTRIEVDDQGKDEVYDILFRAWEEVMQAQTRALERMRGSTDEPIHQMVSILNYRSEPPPPTGDELPQR